LTNRRGGVKVASDDEDLLKPLTNHHYEQEGLKEPIDPLDTNEQDETSIHSAIA
jgi:hypothetical protein